MPHEKITYPSDASSAPGRPKQLVVGWNEIGWVQVSIYPLGWKDTGDAFHVGVNPEEIDKLIKTLKRAKRKAYAAGHRHAGFEDRPAMPEGSDLFPPLKKEEQVKMPAFVTPRGEDA